ncbi:hypothetical protein ACFLR4_03835 [Bacteroidota bacterium]
MIEIKISDDAAINLLVERMNYEYKLRVKHNLIHDSGKLENLDYKDLLNIAETAAFDLVFLLPVEAHVQESNLKDILVKSFRSLAKIYKCHEFNSYSSKNVKTLLKPINHTFKLVGDENSYKYN